MIVFLIGLAIGLITGWLVTLKHLSSAQTAADRGKALLDALKGRKP